jgi:hypothetical protein
MIRYGGDQYEWERGHAKGDTAVRGTASNLLLALWGRRAAEDARLETIGDGDGLDAFRAVTYQG